MRREALREKTVAQIVTENISAAHIFKKHGIDFCCGGGISIAKACERNAVDIEVLEKEILENIGRTLKEEDYNSWSLDALMDRIQNKHHAYVRTTLPILNEYAAKVAKVHGHHYSYLHEVQQIVADTSEELLEHLEKEEQILFPAIKKALLSPTDSTQKSEQHTLIQSPLAELNEEHEQAGEAFKKIAKLTNDYSPPPDACNTFKALYHLLNEFENDLHLHVHLENNILFPKAQLLN